MIDEIWKDVVDFEDLYEVSNIGRVRNKKNGKILSQSIVMNSGYCRVSLTDYNKITKSHNVHKLVARAFISNPDNLPCINHIDEDKTNNIVNNLEYCSYSYNNSYGKGCKIGRRNISQYTKDGELVKV